jgi:hypothetical protein
MLRSQRVHARLGIGALSIAAAALALAAYAALYEIRTYDTLFHLAAGEYSLDHGARLDRDPFSFTFRDAPWLNHSSAFQVLLATLHRLGGFALVSVYQAALAALLCALALFRLRAVPESQRMIAALLTAVPYCAFREVLEARPHVLGFVCLAGSLRLVLLAHETERMRVLAWLLPLHAAWTGSHGSHVLVFVSLAAGLVDAVWRRRWGWLGAYAGLIAGCLAVVRWLAPWAFEQGLEHTGSLFLESAVAEWQPLTAADVLGSWPGRTFALLWLATVAGATLEWRRERRLHLLALLVPLLLLALSSRRMIALFLFGAAPLWLPYAVASLQRLVQARWAAPLSAAGLVACFLVTALQAETFRPGVGLQRDRFPIEAVSAIQRGGRVRRVYNAYNFGGYLMFARQAVFVDGRAITLYPPEFLAAFRAAYEDPRDFEELARRFECDAALLPARSPLAARLRAYLVGSGAWRLTHRDAVAELYERAPPLSAASR